MTDQVGTGMGGDNPEECWLCDAKADADGVIHHAPGCAQGKVFMDRNQLKRDLEARERERQDKLEQDKKKQAPKGEPPQGKPQGTPGKGNMAANFAHLMGQLTDAFGPKPAQQGADGQPLLTPESPEVQQERQRREREDRLTQEQRDALRSIRESRERGVEPDEATRQRMALQEIPDWMTQYLKEHGVPGEVFKEHQYGRTMPDFARLAERPVDADVAPVIRPEPSEEAYKLRAWLDFAYTFWTDIEPSVVQMLKNFESTMQQAYVQAGALYGPTEQGYLQWLGEQAELQRALNTVQRITTEQENRRAVNQMFPRFWKGEWHTGDPQYDTPQTGQDRPTGGPDSPGADDGRGGGGETVPGGSGAGPDGSGDGPEERPHSQLLEPDF